MGNGYCLIIAVGENYQSGVIKKNIESRMEIVEFEGVSVMIAADESTATLSTYGVPLARSPGYPHLPSTLYSVHRTQARGQFARGRH